MMLTRRITQLLVVASLSFFNRPAVAQVAGYHVDNYPAWGQNPGNLNQDLEERPGGGGAPAGWTQVYQYQRGYTFGKSRGIVLPTGFNFRFNGQPVRAVRAYEQFLKLDTLPSASNYVNVPLPNALADRIVYLGYLPVDNRLSMATCRVLTKTFGTAPHRQFWVQWNHLPLGNNPWKGGVQPGYVSVVLEETTNRVFFVYQRMVWWSDTKCLTGAGLQLNRTTAWVADTVRLITPWGMADKTP
ncbi:MAG: hypothetical protein H7330_15120, partial [Hymenobacteraceae bacterium]|nr:hypothetical protein [Hymenobacteraceae bacterium]